MLVTEVLTPWVVACQVLAGVVCLCGDFLLGRPIIQGVAIYKAITDSLTHGLVGLVGWTVVTGASTTLGLLMEVCCCGVLAAVIDVDHFIAARSFHLEVNHT